MGLLLGEWASPLESGYLPLDDSLTVLYGLNGAGKSFVLDALRSAFTGLVPPRLRSTTIYLLAVIPEPDPDRWPLGLARAFESVIGNEWSVDRLLDRMTVQMASAWSQMWENGYHDEFDLKTELASEVAHSRLVLVQPVGLEVPAWVMRPAVIPSAATPATRAFLERIEHLQELGDEDSVGMAPAHRMWGDASSQPLESPTIVFSESFSFLAQPTAGRHPRLWDQVIVEAPEDIDHLTAEALQAVLDGQNDAIHLNELKRRLGVDEDGEVTEWTLDSLVASVQAGANELYGILLRDAPALELELQPPHRWLGHKPLRWIARQLPSDEATPLVWLSHAERRWAELAIRLALSTSRAPLVIIDEPEAALHRTAEAHMAAALARLARESRAQLVVSTHSPELLDQQFARRIFVRRRTLDDQQGRLMPFSAPDLQAIQQLGFLPSDLLRRTRAFLLVEGEHDLIALQGWFDRELSDMRAELLPLRGASRLKTVLDSRFLFDYTEAILCPFLDHVNVRQLQETWAEANRLAKVGPKSEAVDYLRGGLPRGLKGTEFLVPFLTRALQQGLESRVYPLGVERTDILDYLPVQSVVPGGTSWIELRAELKAQKAGAEPSETEFKSWLSKRHGADLSLEALSRVIANSEPPRELVAAVQALSEKLNNPGL